MHFLYWSFLLSPKTARQWAISCALGAGLSAPTWAAAGGLPLRIRLSRAFGENRGAFDLGAVVAAAAGEGLVVGDDSPGFRRLAVRCAPCNRRESRFVMTSSAERLPLQTISTPPRRVAIPGRSGPVEDHHHLLALARPGEEGGENRIAVARPRRPAQNSAQIRGVDQPGHRERSILFGCLSPPTRSCRRWRAPSAGPPCRRTPARTPACWRRRR